MRLFDIAAVRDIGRTTATNDGTGTPNAATHKIHFARTSNEHCARCNVSP
jgi:hypothetical protein